MELNFSNNNANSSSRIALKERLLEKLKQKSSKSTYTEIFMSSKNPKKLLIQLKNQYEEDLGNFVSHGGKQDFRQKFFRDIVMQHLGSKQYKRRKNAFYVMNYLVQTDPYFAEAALKEFSRIKNVLYTIEDFKIFVNSKILEWIDKYSAKFPDLFIWKRSQKHFFNPYNEKAESEKFEDKFQTLKVYRLFFQRDQKEIVQFEARKLMDSSRNKEVEEVKIQTRITESQNGFEFQMDAFVVEDLNLNNQEGEQVLFYEEDASTNIDNQQDQNNQQSLTNKSDQQDIGSYLNSLNRYEATTKNKTLYEVIQDNLKVIERRVIPLLETFKTETAYFKELQNVCLTAVSDKKKLDNNYKGRILISKKQVQDFEKDYKVVFVEEIEQLQREVEILYRSSLELKSDLERIQLIKLQQNNSSQPNLQNQNDVVILDEDEEEDPDDKLFI
ncbi:UNKNOWN [Stylonychia lemnae]|uniref:Uncharacterized protein n=1 Tax=Stylonychia lemnae TaxID=5949 RepID=A0A078BBP2_STYLE|nr:UNKNOWN [Stylonychia lemnae]|eukprot:CDW91809.1 UNKNOWN [Stylonychia lemnae]